MLREGLGGNAVVVVENRPGGNGTVGLEVLAKAAPDGYTLGLTAITLAIAPHQGNGGSAENRGAGARQVAWVLHQSVSLYIFNFGGEYSAALHYISLIHHPRLPAAS